MFNMYKLDFIHHRYIFLLTPTTCRNYNCQEKVLCFAWLPTYGLAMQSTSLSAWLTGDLQEQQRLKKAQNDHLYKKLTRKVLECSTDHFWGKWCNFNHSGYIHCASQRGSGRSRLERLALWNCFFLAQGSWEALVRPQWRRWSKLPD